MRRVFIAACTLASLVLLLSCSTSSNLGTTPTTSNGTSGLKKRAFVSVAFNSAGGGNIDIVDAAKDLFLGNNIGVNPGAGLMAVSPDKTITLVFESTGNSMSIVDNASEAQVAAISLPAAAQSQVIGSDNKTAWVAMRNALAGGTGTQPGAIAVIDLSGKDVTQNIAIPQVKQLVLSHNGAKLLAFSDSSNSLTVIDTASKSPTTVAGFDRPVWGVFSSDDSKAYILSCGPECGGSRAQVTILDMGTLIPGTSIPVSAAETALLNSSTLYVAGTVPTGSSAGIGKLDIIDTGAFSVTKSGIGISDGYHSLMALGSNNQLYIGARTCSGVGGSSCLSVFDTSKQTATIVPVTCSSAPTANPCQGDVTAIQPISGRTVTYVVEGGELIIFNDTTATPASSQIDIVGQAIDVKSVD